MELFFGNKKINNWVLIFSALKNDDYQLFT